MTKELEGLTWQCAWTSHMGCVKGCLNWLREHGAARERRSSATNMSLAWLFGGTGHAFVINLHDEVCPSSPTAWNTEMLYHLAPNLGYRLTVVWSDKRHPDFPAKQEAAWAYVRGCIDKNIPCYGWELRVPEFYTIHGYDEAGYYYRGPGADEGAGPKPWRELGATDIGCLELYSVQVCEPASDAVAVKAALQFALDHAERPGKWVFPKYRTGPEAFAAWADSLEQGRALRSGQGYNGEVWAECRGQAVSFLREAKDRLAGKAPGLFDEAIEHYSAVHACLKNTRDLHPFHGPSSGESDRLKSPDAAALVRKAGEAERKGLETLRKIVGVLSS